MTTDPICISVGLVALAMRGTGQLEGVLRNRKFFHFIVQYNNAQIIGVESNIYYGLRKRVRRNSLSNAPA